MKQRPPDRTDPTSELQPPEIDGTATVQLDDTCSARVVTASESAYGAIGFTTGSTNRKETTNRLRALEPEPEPLTESGSDPDATGVFVLPKIDE